MAKSRAEIQKAYRERQKAKNREEFLKKERERVKKLYIPTCQLTRREQMRRNIKNNINLTRHRLKKKQQSVAVVEEEARPETMVVKLPFSRKAAGKRRVSKALGKRIKEVNKLRETLKRLKTKHKSAMRKIQRLKARSSQSSSQGSSQDTEEEANTPRSKTRAELRNINKEDANRIRKQLLLSNVLMAEVKEAKKANKKKSTILHQTLSGKIVKKYRCLSSLNRKTGLSRRSLAKTACKSFEARKEQRKRARLHYEDAVLAFLERDDNSRVLPGKNDKKRMEDGQTKQKRVLTDYLSNLYDKFTSENPTAKISQTSFQRLRPAYILTTSFISRSSCLCTKHQNAALLLKTLQRYVAVQKNPEDFIKETLPIDEMNRELPDDVTFSLWKRVPVEEANGQKKMITKIVQVNKSKTDFIAYVTEQFTNFKEHVARMKNQYKEIRSLKANLPPHHHVIHMDFAENFNCKSMDEVQSAYWCQTFITLHPTVIYSGTEDASQPSHSSYVYISDELNHNATTVITFVKDLIEQVKVLDPEAECVHYWTDGPTSQYRNKTVFYLVSHHKELFDLEATWHFFEAGHGKGPCDGIGGVTKRNADIATKAGKCVIQSASDFYAWTQSEVCNLRSIKFIYIPKESCMETGEEIKNWPTKPVKGTMKLHSIIGKGEGSILVRDTSCCCSDCLAGNNMCEGWREEKVAEPPKNQEPAPEDAPGDAPDDAPGTPGAPGSPGSPDVQEDLPQVDIGDFVAATYEQVLYIGKVIEIDMGDEYCYRISFMEKKTGQYQWPKRQDIIWCAKEAVQFHISEPLPSGKSRRLFKVAPEDRKRLEEFEIV